MILPQEIEVFYVIPAVRRELASALSELNFSQKRIAELFGVTEACISNYFKSKRGGKVVFGPEIQALINEYALKLSKGECCFISTIQVILKAFKENNDLCALHKELDDHTCGCKGCFL